MRSPMLKPFSMTPYCCSRTALGRALSRLRPGAERYDCGSDLGRAETAFEPFQAVVDQETDPIAAPETGGAQGRGDPPGGIGEITVGRPPLTADHRNPLGKALGLLVQQPVKRPAVRRPHINRRLDPGGRSATNRVPCRRWRFCSTSCG